MNFADNIIANYNILFRASTHKKMTRFPNIDENIRYALVHQIDRLISLV